MRRARGGSARQGVRFHAMPEKPLSAPPPDAEPGDPAGAARTAWWQSPVLVGLAVSFFLHSALLLMLAVTIFTEPASGEAGEGDEIQLAVMQDSELTDLVESLFELHQPVIQNESMAPEIVIEDLHSPLADLGTVSISEDVLGAIRGAGAAGGGASSELFSAGTAARFFGIEAQGSRFAYVIDVSGSMDEQRSAALKHALIASIQALSDDARFAIILYNDRATPLTGDGWVTCNDSARATARQRINAIHTGGGTNPVAAFELVRTLKPLPDAVYFMTDGEFNQDVEDALFSTVSNMVRLIDAPMPIHAITFVSKSAETLMKRLARMTRGSYTHVEGPRR